jgi:crotonobetainyl-CoA:carnitine CoA-transferase CaiB-like acyl-CoA transferase
MLYGLISHSGLATVALDYTKEFFPLGVMLCGLVPLSGAMIALAAVRHHRSRTGKPEIATTPLPRSYDTAA